MLFFGNPRETTHIISSATLYFLSFGEIISIPTMTPNTVYLPRLV